MIMNAQDFLEQLQKIDAMIENKTIEKEQWKSIAQSITSSNATIIINGVEHAMEKVQASGEQQKMAAAIASYVDIEREIDQIIAQKVAKRKEIISVIELLPATEYDVIHKLYVQNLSMDEVAFRCGNYTTAWVGHVKRKAFDMIQKILDEGGVE